jgi:soluble P-type ATPase
MFCLLSFSECVRRSSMVEVSIPCFGQLELHHLVLDFNGTLAQDGALIEGVWERLAALSHKLNVHVVTADTFGQAAMQLAGLACEVAILPPGEQAAAKREYVVQLGTRGTVSIGNGRNDRLMLAESVLGIAVVQEEGAAAGTLLAADIVCSHIVAALDLLENPLRLVATLRS